MGRVTALLLLLTSGAAAAQGRLPPEDATGRPLVQPETLQMAMHHQQMVIYLLLALLVFCLGALLWLGTAFLRMQYTVERVAEAVRRVDLLAEAFRSVSLDWARGAPSKPPAFDLDEEEGHR